MVLKQNTMLSLAGLLSLVCAAPVSAGVTAACKRRPSGAGGMTGLPAGDAADLDGYLTREALDGLSTMVAVEEKRIRENPETRSPDLLKKVFGSVSP
jgi:hypothetical protein